MNAFEYAAEMARIKALPSGERHKPWRAAKSARQRYLNRQRREHDPSWWERTLERSKAARRHPIKPGVIRFERRGVRYIVQHGADGRIMGMERVI